jgi:hypothetical protein
MPACANRTSINSRTSSQPGNRRPHQPTKQPTNRTHTTRRPQVEAKLKYADDLRKALEMERSQLAASRRQVEAERQRLADERAKKGGAVVAALAPGGVVGLLPQAAAAVPAAVGLGAGAAGLLAQQAQQ